MGRGLTILAVGVVLALVLVAFDRLLVWLMHLLLKHGDISVEFGGPDSMGMEVIGSGLMAEFLSVFIEGFSSGSGANFSLGFAIQTNLWALVLTTPLAVSNPVCRIPSSWTSATTSAWASSTSLCSFLSSFKY